MKNGSLQRPQVFFTLLDVTVLLQYLEFLVASPSVNHGLDVDGDMYGQLGGIRRALVVS